MPRRVKDIGGQRFGNLVADLYEKRKNGLIYWHCQCDCGQKKVIAGKTLKDTKKKLKLMCDYCKLKTFKRPEKTRLYESIYGERKIRVYRRKV